MGAGGKHWALAAVAAVAAVGLLTGSALMATSAHVRSRSVNRLVPRVTSSEVKVLVPAEPAPVCGNTSLLAGPSTPPRGAVKVRAGDDTKVIGENWLVRPRTTYWFAPGTHTLGTSIFGQIEPQSGDTFIGAPGAVIDGQGVNRSAFVGTATDVTIEYLTIEDFAPLNAQNVVNHDDGASWTVDFNTVQDNTSSGSAKGPDYPGGLPWDGLR